MKRQVAAMFAEEKPALLPLPVEPFRYYQYGERTVHLDGCVEVEAAYYGAPPGWIGRRVHVQWNEAHVRLIDPLSGQLRREHLRQQRGRRRIRSSARRRVVQDDYSGTPIEPHEAWEIIDRWRNQRQEIGIINPSRHGVESGHPEPGVPR
jgi:hypothetical protein